MTATQRAQIGGSHRPTEFTEGCVRRTFYHVAAAALTYLLRVHMGAVRHE